MPVEWRFAADDVARLRFAFSPMWELVTSLRVLRAPARHSLHLPWLRAVRPRLRDLDLAELFALLPLTGYIPDFLTPPPDTPLPDFAAELERVRLTPPDMASEEVASVRTADPEAVARFRDDPAKGVQRVADRLQDYWTVAFEEFWPTIHGLLDADVMWRSRRLAAGGVRELFADLHASVAWHGDRLVTVKECDFSGDIGGDGLVLVPSAFGWPDVSIMYEPYRPMLSYPARGIGTLWSGGAPCTPNALSALIGRTRAQILVALEDPVSTTALARRLDLTPGAVSQHFTVLSDGGLVTRQRLGREVLYRRTSVGDTLACGA
ncbi:winged helix-turn-helix domain-containing protein [Planotetraspora sp. A-T 1434]|uniref:ArsR/SmtB family transcription factor n=1 Tax=Planotetraspora sp. A-T 1434 TaxID=2979219 RepID=UPI0021C1AE20|nr:winged helix-turn-helix domain-containing protein [Planotetraspora sp. A-T 1434]MCT9930041.1 winged helix-turn-helix domain-containing protein [Planotetraspora sp. A-T 1434]